MFHWLEATKSPVINLFSYSFFNSDNQLIQILIGCGFLFSLGLNDNKYFVGSNGCHLYTS